MACAPSKSEPPPPQHHHYTPLPHDQNDNVLPLSSSHHPRRITISVFVTLLLLISASAYVFWPSDPSLKIVRLRLKRVQVHTRPRVAIDVSMLVRIKVSNSDVYSMDYEALEVGVGYRGKRLGEVRFQQGHVRAFGSSYVDAEVEFSGVGVFSDVVLLLEDLAKGTVPFDTVTEVRGKLGILFFHFPLQARVSCEVLVNTVNQTIFRHSCYEKKSNIVVSPSREKEVASTLIALNGKEPAQTDEKPAKADEGVYSAPRGRGDNGRGSKCGGGRKKHGKGRKKHGKGRHGRYT